MHTKYSNPRTDHPLNNHVSAFGQVRLDGYKVVWIVTLAISGSVGSYFFFSWDAVILCLLSCGVVLLLGHSLGMHRLFIHNAFQCPRWLQLFLLHMGTVVGIAGPISMLKTHDTRDWAQRQTACHDYFSHNSPWWKDLYWQLLCRIDLNPPLTIHIEPAIKHDRAIYFMERFWILQQLQWALLFYVWGGWGYVFWGISTRILLCNLGHWWIGYLAHNDGHRSWHVSDACVQGYNIPWAAIITMGECWHNNHHAHPESANFGLKPNELDIGWWVLKWLQHLGLVSHLKQANIDSEREGLQCLIKN